MLVAAAAATILLLQLSVFVQLLSFLELSAIKEAFMAVMAGTVFTSWLAFLSPS